MTTSHLVSQGDFYVSRGNGSKKLVGIGGLVVEKPEPIAFPDTFIRIRINSNMCDINYLSLLWNSHLLRSQIEKCARTTAGIYKINQGHICSFIIPLPSIEEQKEIIYQLEDVLSKISNLENSCETESVRSETLRQSILKKAFSGKPTVSLGVTCAVVDTYGCDNGRIAPTRCAIIAAGLDGK
jgi:type I restriction enzyme S subunit